MAGLASTGFSNFPSEVLTASLRGEAAGALGVTGAGLGATAAGLGAVAGVLAVGVGVASFGVLLRVAAGALAERGVEFAGALGVVLAAVVGVRAAGDEVVLSRD